MRIGLGCIYERILVSKITYVPYHKRKILPTFLLFCKKKTQIIYVKYVCM